ncbi:hypothetical protein G7046_g3391 [Stylonectria norvegica]|nr:hypothetical protein G7046_g3391 [Stylonectria norvegica]
MKFVRVVAGLAGTATALINTADIFSTSANVAAVDHKIPTSYESAVMARRILALTKLATLSTVFPGSRSDGADASEDRPAGLEGLPVGLMDYVADCEEEGNPTILEIKIATTFKNVRAGSNITLSMNWVPPYPPSKRITLLSRLSAYVPFLSSSPYNTGLESTPTPDTVPYSAANLPRFSLIGYLEPIDPNPVAALKLAACFTSKHPDAKYWLPGNMIHESQWSRLVVTKVYWIGGFGDRARIGWLPTEEWKNVTRKEWEAIKLQGEEKGWSTPKGRVQSTFPGSLPPRPPTDRPLRTSGDPPLGPLLPGRARALLSRAAKGIIGLPGWNLINPHPMAHGGYTLYSPSNAANVKRCTHIAKFHRLKGPRPHGDIEVVIVVDNSVPVSVSVSGACIHARYPSPHCHPTGIFRGLEPYYLDPLAEVEVRLRCAAPLAPIAARIPRPDRIASTPKHPQAPRALTGPPRSPLLNTRDSPSLSPRPLCIHLPHLQHPDYASRNGASALFPAMTSRTPMGVQPRPPQRSVSSSSLSVQRPPHHRTLSQQYLPASPVRKETSFIDLTGDSNDVPSSRHVPTPRRGGSRLKLELSNDNSSGPLSTTGSPQILTPSRTLVADPMDIGNTSPAVSRTSQQDPDNPPMPMPKRRPPASQPTSTPRSAPTAPAPKKDAKPKPYVVEIPPAAPRYLTTKRLPEVSTRSTSNPFSQGLNSGYADFFPWNGNHHEDDWTSEAIQKGVFDKLNMNFPENASAKMAIFPALKQKSGVTALSTIFMGVLNQRRHRGQINAPSTFKPPPRVTLTDTKREVWLKDLANPAISLRRLSRTIPHGIRGRTLLDQSLNKNVPTERAVWLAKCVGANELRAFKRKGVNNGAFVMGGELKWARDWTVCVEQFVDAVVSAFGEDEWKARVTYAIRLATNLYSELLLDRDHYLDWVVSGIENSQQSRMPMWILIAQIYWKDLMQSRKYGRRLVFAFLSHLYVIHNDPDRDILAQLSSRLSALLSSLVESNPESFVCPSAWPKYRETLLAFLQPEHETTRKAVDSIHRRNSRLLVASTASPPAGRKQLVKLLDSTLQHSIDNDFAAKCWATSDDKPTIVKTLVEWATSFHRPGLAKIYVAATLVRAWCNPQNHATSAILGLLDGIADQDETRKQLVYRLVTELVRTGHFSVPQYVQWVIARGGYHEEAEIDPDDGPCATRLLVELPIHALSEKRRTERGNLLRRAGDYSVAQEENDITNAIKCVKHTLRLPLPPGDPLSERKPLSLTKLLRLIGNSSNALRSCVGAQLRGIITTQAPGKPQPSMSLTMFTSVRAIMESIEDFSMLSDILISVTTIADATVLASCADTVNANLQIFCAIGSADDLLNSLIERLKSINAEHGIVPRPLLAALSTLAQRMAGHENIASQLRTELLQSDRSNAFDACSPVSDNMAIQQSPEGEVAEEIDKLLASGTRLDPPTMNRLFRTIIPRLDTGWRKKDDTRRVFATLLAKIRVFDMQHFDKLMTDWTSHVRSMPNRPPLSDLLPLLVSTSCLGVSIILGTASPLSMASHNPAEQTPTQHSSATYLQELLQLVIMPLPMDTGLTPEENYRFRTEQKCAKSGQSKGLLNLVRNSLLEFSGLRGQASGLKLPLDDTLCQESLLETLRLLVLVDSTAVSSALSIKCLPPDAIGMVQKVTTKLLVPGDGGDEHTSFDQILYLANELTLPFCQLKLNLDLSMSQSTAGDGEDQGAKRFDLFAKAMDRAIEAGNIMWTSLLPCLSDDITQHLKSQAQSGFLDLMPSLKAANLAVAASAPSIHMAENLLGVVEAIISGQPPLKSAQLTIAMAEKLADLWEIVAAGPKERPHVHTAVLQHWLPTMLRFVTLHSLSSEPPSAPLPSASATKPPIPTGHDTRARIILVLCGLLLELETLPPATTGSLAQQVFDIAILLADALPEDLRAHCARAILLTRGGTASIHASSDPRLYYLFSAPRPAAADTLMLAHREKATSPQTAATRGMAAHYGIGPPLLEKLTPFVLRRWEVLSEPTPNMGENDTSLSLGLFEAIKIQ